MATTMQVVAEIEANVTAERLREYASDEYGSDSLDSYRSTVEAALGTTRLPWDEAVDVIRERWAAATDERIAALRAEAESAGDMVQVAICDRALDGDDAAIVECVRAIAEAAARVDDEVA